MRTRKEILKEREALVEEYQGLRGKTDPKAKERIEEIGARFGELDDELDVLKEAGDAASENPSPREYSKRAMWIAVAVIFAIGALVYWVIWSQNERARANRYAGQITQAWKNAATAEADLKNQGETLKAAEARIKELETTVAKSTASGPGQAAPISPSGTPVAGTAQAPTPDPNAQAASAPSDEVLKLATVGKGEGLEHAFIRQLKDNPEEFGFDGDAEDKAAVKKWAGKQAHRFAIKAGYVCPESGREMRVKAADKIAFVLYKDTDGNLMVAEYEKDSSGNFKNDPSDEGPVKEEGATFEGDTSDGVQTYEYVFSTSLTSEPVPAVSSLAVPTAPVVAVAEFWSRA